MTSSGQVGMTSSGSSKYDVIRIGSTFGSGQKSGSGALIGSGQNPGRALNESGQKSGSGVDRVGSKIRVGDVDRFGSKIRVGLRPSQDDVILTSTSGNLNRSDRVV